MNDPNRFTAAEEGDLPALLRLFAADPTAVRTGNEGGWTLLHSAAGCGRCEAVELLLRLGADADAATSEGTTPLALAIADGRLPTVELLLAAGADPDRVSPREISTGFCCGEPELLRFLVALRPNWVHGNRDASFEDGRSPLHEAALCGQADAVELLLAAGADPNAPCDGRTPLHEAARSRDPATLAALLRHGADPNRPDSQGEMPLSYVRADEAAAGVLLAAGARPDLESALYLGLVAEAIALLKAGHGPPVRPFGNPLYFAAKSQSLELAKLLLDCGCDPAGGYREILRAPAIPLTAVTREILHLLEKRAGG